MDGALIHMPLRDGGSQLVTFERVKRAIAEAKTLPDVAKIKTGIGKLQALERMRGDRQAEADLSVLYQECIIQIGVVSRELEKGKQGGSKFRTGGSLKPTKAKALREAGISKSLAAEAEEIAGGRTKLGQDAARAAADVTFAKARADKKPVTKNALRNAVRETLAATLGPPPKRKPKRKPKPDPTLDHLLALTGAIEAINELAVVSVELVELSTSLGEIEAHLAAADIALVLLRHWRDALATAHVERSLQ